MAKAKTPALGWWGERWLTYLQDELLLWSMTPGEARSAERGDARLTFARGEIRAQIEVGSYGHKETATLKIKPLGVREWRRIETAIAQDPEVAHRLVSGSPGAELETAFARAGSALFPPEHGKGHRCTCNQGWGCRHQRVLAVRAARLFEANPFLWLQVLGCGREELLAAVRAQMADQAGHQGQGHLAATSLARLLDPDRYLSTDIDPGGIPVRPGEAQVPDALLRFLGPLPLPAELKEIASYQIVKEVHWGQTYPVSHRVTETAEQVLTRYYREISQGAAALALGDRRLPCREEPLPGKRLPLRGRLVAEIAAAIDEAGTCLNLQTLAEDCPTAAALYWESAVRALEEAAADLPDGYTTLGGGRYVARCDTILAGAAFRHVVTWDEWQQGRLDGSADWARALSLAGAAPPFEAAVDDALLPILQPVSAGAREPLFEHVRPEVGDELHITVEDPTRPLLGIQLRRRAQRNLLERLPADQTAARFLASHVPDDYGGLPEGEAVELLLAEGSYRPGRTPDPVWLLPFKAVGEGLRWGRGRTLTTRNWAWGYTPGGYIPHWRSDLRERLANAFHNSLLSQRLNRKEVKVAEALSWAWLRRWTGDPLEPLQPPSMGAFLHYFLIDAPIEAYRQRLSAESALAALGSWFRFLVETSPRMEPAYRPFLVALGHVEPFRHRLATVPPGRQNAMHDAWEMDGLRWMGPQHCV